MRDKKLSMVGFKRKIFFSDYDGNYSYENLIGSNLYSNVNQKTNQAQQVFALESEGSAKQRNN